MIHTYMLYIWYIHTCYAYDTYIHVIHMIHTYMLYIWYIHTWYTYDTYIHDIHMIHTYMLYIWYIQTCAIQRSLDSNIPGHLSLDDLYWSLDLRVGPSGSLCCDDAQDSFKIIYIHTYIHTYVHVIHMILHWKVWAFKWGALAPQAHTTCHQHCVKTYQWSILHYCLICHQYHYGLWLHGLRTLHSQLPCTMNG